MTDVGENRVQEAIAKLEAAGSTPVAWHLIGTLQRNKARHGVGRFALVHSVDRADLPWSSTGGWLPARGQAVLVQVNCSDEAQKGGVAPTSCCPSWSDLGACAQIEVAWAHDDERTDRGPA